MKKIKIALSIFLILFVIGAIALQSEWGKGLAQKFLVEALKESGFKVQIGAFQGAIPHAIDLKDVKVESPSLDISIDSLKTRLSIWALLKKELLFTSVDAKGISWVEKGGGKIESLKEGKGLSFSLKVKQFSLSEVHVPQYGDIDFKGSLRLGKSNRDLFLELTASEPAHPDSKLHFIAYRDEGGALRVKGDFKSATLKPLPFKLPFDAEANLKFTMRKKLKRWTGKISGTLVPEPLDLGEWSKPLDAPLALDARFALSEQGLQLSSLKFENQSIHGFGTASFQSTGTFEKASLTIQTDQPHGALKLDLFAEEGGIAMKALGNFDPLHAHHFNFQKVQAQIDALWDFDRLKGNATAAGLYHGKLFKAKTGFDWKKGDSLFLNAISLQGPNLTVSGQGELRPDNIFLGETELQIDNLQDLPLNLYGKLSGKIDWLVSSGKQVVTLGAEASAFYWNDLYAEKMGIDISLIDPFGDPKGRAVFDCTKMKWHQMLLDHLRFETLLGAENWPFALSALGEWIHPLNLNLDGTWRYQKESWKIYLQTLSGRFYRHPILLNQPTDFIYSPDLLSLSGLDLKIATGRFFLLIESLENALQAQLSLEKFPLDVLSLNPLDVPIAGQTDCKISLVEKGGKIDGKLEASVQQMQVATPNAPLPISAAGKIEGRFNNETLKVNGALNLGETPLVALDLMLPIQLSLRPLDIHLIYDEPTKGAISLNGQIEEILDFFDLGTHRIEGKIDCSFNLANTLADPQIKGSLHFQNGYYENYLTGTRLLDIEATGNAKGHTFRLDTFSANDGKGTLSASGAISLLPAEWFPYDFEIALDRFQIAQIDLVNAQAEGKIRLSGNLKEALAQGTVHITQSDLHVPERLPRSLPNLVVVYRNATKPPELPPVSSFKPPFPLNLDLEVEAPEGILIEGRGLNSEWKGNFHVGGTYTSLATTGKLELIKGEFQFSSRRFKLLDGSLSFQGTKKEMPYLNLSAQIDVKEISITARLKGPLNNPQLTLQSVPPLPLSTIMSYLLFGQELAEINSFQALQLANSLASLAGQGPDVLENTRKALGVDRLNIVSVSHGDAEIEDTIAVQVGKYISEGVLVSLTQGAEESSTNISIEIELKGGWAVQLESDQRQEQGKFTIKWNHNL